MWPHPCDITRRTLEVTYQESMMGNFVQFLNFAVSFNSLKVFSLNVML